MSGIKDLKTSLKLYVLTGITIIGFVTLGTIALTTLNEVKVNGPIYQSIDLGKSLDSDVSPAQLYISETRMDLLALVNEKEEGKLPTRMEELNGGNWKEARHIYRSPTRKLSPPR